MDKLKLWEKLVDVWANALMVSLSLLGVGLIIVMTIFSYKGVTAQYTCSQQEVGKLTFKMNKYGDSVNN